MTDDRSLEQVAAHEAGHAVVALRLGYNVRLLTIIPQPGSTVAGACIFDPAPAGEHGAPVRIAGEVAEDLIREQTRPAPRRPAGAAWYRQMLIEHRRTERQARLRRTEPKPPSRPEGILTDAEHLRRAAEGSTRNFTQLCNRAERQATPILTRDWKSVYAVAAELLAHGEIEGEGIVAIVEKASGRKVDAWRARAAKNIPREKSRQEPRRKATAKPARSMGGRAGFAGAALRIFDDVEGCGRGLPNRESRKEVPRTRGPARSSPLLLSWCR